MALRPYSGGGNHHIFQLICIAQNVESVNPFGCNIEQYSKRAPQGQVVLIMVYQG